MKSFITTIVLIATATLPALADNRAPDAQIVFGADQQLKEGEKAMYAGDLEKAIELFLVGLPHASTKRNEAAALNNLCAAYGTLGKFQTALEYCAQALELRPLNWRAHANRARSLVGIGEVDAAIESANRGLEIAPKARALHEILELAQSYKAEPHVIIETLDINRKN